MIYERQGLNKVARSVPGSGPRAAQATLGARARPLGQFPEREDYL